MTIFDQFMLALTAWRENRGGGNDGMQSVINVILNRAKLRGTTPYSECVRPLQFSSITAHADPELNLWPGLADPQWSEALSLASLASLGNLDDITQGATLYYAPLGLVPKSKKTFTLPSGELIPFPNDWNESAVHYLTTIKNQVFFK